MKFLQATEQASMILESQKRDILQEYVDDYEANVYRVRIFYQNLINLIYFSGKKTLLYVNILSFKQTLDSITFIFNYGINFT